VSPVALFDGDDEGLIVGGAEGCGKPCRELEKPGASHELLEPVPLGLRHVIEIECE
jgi:hypothetical protein